MKKLFLFILFCLLGLTLTGKAYALEAPQLNAKYLGGDKVWLWWTPVTGATYQVLYGPREHMWAHGVTLGEGTSYTVGQLFRNTSYVFAVKAVRGDQVSVLSNWVTVATGGTARSPLAAVSSLPSPQPVAPMPLVASLGPMNGTVTLRWSEMPDGAYNIVYTDNPTMEKWGVLNIPIESRSYTIGGLMPGRMYWFWLATKTSKQTLWASSVAR